MKFEYSAGAFVYRIEKGEAQILFLMREDGKFDIPKGHIEKGENAAQAGKREILEESGLKVDFISGFKDASKYFFIAKGTKIFKRVTLFLAKVHGDNVVVSHEHADYKWLGEKEALGQVGYKNMQKLLRRVFEYVARYEQISKINAEYAKLPAKTSSWDLSKTFVPGEGPLDAKTIFLGQAPGANEDILRRPFVGRSGKVLDQMIKYAGTKRENVYITSCVQFFPPKNRGPTDKEIELCKKFLLDQIKIIKPKNIVLLGNFACNNMLGYDKVSQNHGKIVEKDEIMYFITFHPAMALRSSVVVAKQMQEDFESFKGKL